VNDGDTGRADGRKEDPAAQHLYWADVEGVIENVGGVLKITTIRVRMHLKCPGEKEADAKEAFANYLARCPAAQSVKDCIRLQDELILER